MGWWIKCNVNCGRQTWASNILELINDHRDESGWFICQCGNHGHIEKKFDLQEPGETWEPYLRGIITLGVEAETYQPFVFLVSGEPTSAVNDIWFSYYKDTRPTGGRLKLGYGPGGPPVLGKEQILQILCSMRTMGCLSNAEIEKALKEV